MSAGSKRFPYQVTNVLVFLVKRIQHGFQELHEAGDAADVLRGSAALAIDEGRVLNVGLAVANRFDDDVVPPVVSEVVHVEERVDSPVDERPEA